MPILAANNLAPLDWVIIGAYFAVIVVTGILFARRKQTGTEDYFLAGKSMPVWAVAISLLATAQSAATFVGAPQQSYGGSLVYLSTNIGGVIGAAILVFFFIPAFYRHGVATPYSLLEKRFGHVSVLATSWAYLVGRVFASGARIFIAAIPVAIIIYGYNNPKQLPTDQLMVGIWSLTAVGIVYTLAGGIRSVIWTDVIQAVVYISATLGAMFLLLDKIPIGIGEIISTLRTAGPDGSSKLTIVDPGVPFDASQSMTFLTAITGFVLLTVASHGTDNDMVQRLLTCRSKGESIKSVLSGILIGIPVVALFLIVGLLLFIFYQRPELMGANAPSEAPKDDRQVLLSFILTEMPPGLAGMMMAGLFAAGLSSVNSTLNAMSSSFVNDIYKRHRKNRSEQHYLRVGRFGVVVAGLLLGVFASLCILWNRAEDSTLIDFALSVMAFAYSGLLGVFFTGLFTRRGNNVSVIAALLVGFLSTLVMTGFVWSPLMNRLGLEEAASLNIAYPWRLVIGTVLATAVCVAFPSNNPETAASRDI